MSFSVGLECRPPDTFFTPRPPGYALHSCVVTGAQEADVRLGEGGGGDGGVQQCRQAFMYTAESL